MTLAGPGRRATETFPGADSIAEAYRLACLDELRAPKAGNVHDFGDGHGMTVSDFEASAEVTAAWIAKPAAPVGERIKGAIAATRKAVDCNTNLGIVLMSAPLARAAEDDGTGDLSGAVARVLAALDIADAQDVFDAIMLAAPAGLGDSAEHDVRAPATVTLLQAMAAAADRDRIAWNYVNGFADVFDAGIPAFRDALSRWNDWRWATAAVHFTFMSAFPDTHIFREHGADAAAAARRAALAINQELAEADAPERLTPKIMQIDAMLKAKGHNPGTSADLTVATLFAIRLSGLRSVAGNG